MYFYRPRIWQCGGRQEVEAVCCGLICVSAPGKAWQTATTLPPSHQLGECCLLNASCDQFVLRLCDKVRSKVLHHHSKGCCQNYAEDPCPACLGQVLGEYSHLREELDPSTVLRLLVKLLDMKQTSSETKSYVLMAMTKLCWGGEGASIGQEVAESYSSSLDTVLRQRVHELQHLSQNVELRSRVLPGDAGLEPLEVIYKQSCQVWSRIWL